jgi:muramidase (phage lysozyme)
MTNNQKAFLDAIAVSEIGKELLAVSDNGYDVMVGSTAEHPLLFANYSRHPNVYNQHMNSTAAGRYQLLYRYYVSYTRMLGLDDFSPDSQDAIALQQIKERHAIDDIEAGNFDRAIAKCGNIWASLPGSPYGQHTNTIELLRTAYIESGGTLA